MKTYTEEQLNHVFEAESKLPKEPNAYDIAEDIIAKIFNNDSSANLPIATDDYAQFTVKQNGKLIKVTIKM